MLGEESVVMREGREGSRGKKPPDVWQANKPMKKIPKAEHDLLVMLSLRDFFHWLVACTSSTSSEVVGGPGEVVYLEFTSSEAFHVPVGHREGHCSQVRRRK